MKPRRLLTASEVDELLRSLEGRLHGVGVETQPEVATKILSLISDPDAGLKQYAEVVRADPALSGRLLRLANSAYFAQREPVTNLDRACVLLGLERLKAVSLGFHLSRAASDRSQTDLTRRVWTHGVYRACLTAELSRTLCPGFASEAFVVGLMLDCGLPLMPRLLGEQAAAIIARDEPPPLQFRAEFENLPFTHVDVAAALARRWRLPELLSRPIERHHAQPSPGARSGPVQLLHRLAYYVGGIQFDAQCNPQKGAGLSAEAEGLLGINSSQLGQIVARAGQEYGAMAEFFREVAGGAANVSAMAESVQGQLVELMDQMFMAQIGNETRAAQGAFVIAEQQIEVEAGRTGVAVAYLVDSSGTRLLSYVFRPGTETVAQILDALGIEHYHAPEATELDAYLRSLAA
jgi:HD-like signal output (HDOD) protein